MLGVRIPGIGPRQSWPRPNRAAPTPSRRLPHNARALLIDTGDGPPALTRLGSDSSCGDILPCQLRCFPQSPEKWTGFCEHSEAAECHREENMSKNFIAQAVTIAVFGSISFAFWLIYS